MSLDSKASKEALRSKDQAMALRTRSIDSPLALFECENSKSTTFKPRALRALGRIVDGGLCHRCGSCIGICPTSVLSCDEENYPTVKNLSACTDCDLCVKVCPGDELDFQDFYHEKFGVKPDQSDTHGQIEAAYVAHSSDESLRKQGTSGGVVSQILIDLLESNEIDGAIVIASDESTLWKGKPIVARSKEQIIAAAKSKYSIAPTNEAFAEIREIQGRYALVGLPCQIHGFHKAAALDQRIKERVVLTVGLLCHAAIEDEAFKIIWKKLGNHTQDASKFVSRIGKHPGAPHIKRKEGDYYPVYFGDKSGYRPSSMEVINILYRLYTPARCLTCFRCYS